MRIQGVPPYNFTDSRYDARPEILGYFLFIGPVENQNTYVACNKKTHDIMVSANGGALTGAYTTANPLVAIAGGALGSAWTWAFY